MRRSLLLACLAACESGHAPSGGFVAFAQQDTFHLMTVDLNGTQRTLDEGTHGEIAISPDGRWIATAGTERNVRLYGRDGAKRTDLLPSGADCLATPRWHGTQAVGWCTVGADNGTVFLPDPKGTPRVIATHGLISSPDGRRIAYVIPEGPATVRGMLVVENADGTDQHVLANSADMHPQAFSTDGAFLVVLERVDNGVSTRVNRFTIADGTMTTFGPGAVLGLPATQASSASRSPDGSEILMKVDGDLVAVEIASGTQRRIATLATGVELAGAGFIDRDRLIYVQHHDMTQGDVEIYEESVHLVDASTDVTLLPASEGTCYVAGVGLETGVVAIDCFGAHVVDFGGTELAGNASRVVGLASDESGIITVTSEGAIELVPIAGAPRELARSATHFVGNPFQSVFAPFVAYSP